VPRISFFYGIAIFMYWNEGVHARPHFHARYGGQSASVDFNGEVLAGALPPRAINLITEWAGLHRAELEANWERSPRTGARSDRAASLGLTAWSSWSTSRALRSSAITVFG
jgi:Domain of unknown function (DUF4160)